MIHFRRAQKCNSRNIKIIKKNPENNENKVHLMVEWNVTKPQCCLFIVILFKHYSASEVKSFSSSPQRYLLKGLKAKKQEGGNVRSFF
jgi:hypothetical protein